MRRLLVCSFVVLNVCLSSLAQAEELQTEEKLLQGLQPVMVDITERDPPSDEEWQAIHEEVERGGALGNLADFRSRTIAFMNTRYLTANPAEATLASYGKMGTDKRYDRFGHINGVEFEIEQNSWKQRHVLNAAALLKLAGSRFMEYAGVGVDAAVESKRQIAVTFIGTAVPKDEAIRRLNSDLEALEYLDTVQRKRAEYDKNSSKLFAGKAPPAPKIVLANVVMLDGNFSDALDASVDGKLHSRVVGDALELKAVLKNGQEVMLLSPVVRCYRTYSIEFKTDAKDKPVMVDLTDREGKPHKVPQVFDLTPDL